MKVELNNKSIPEGMRDIIFEEARRYRQISDKLAEVYTRAGFSEVITPAIEYLDVFSGEDSYMNPEEIFKFTDQNGRLVALRADNTMPIARMASTKLRNEKLPLKLYYNQNSYRIRHDYSGHHSEGFQSGIEMIGLSGTKSDLVCLTTALEALNALDTGCKLEIGHVGYYNSLISELTLDESEREKIRGLVDSKNAVSLDGMSENRGLDRIRRIPLLFGGGEIFAEAEKLAGGNKGALDALNYVKRLYSLLCSAGYEDRILIDFGIVHKIDYYTGVVFRGYMHNAGKPVLAGGRYDSLLRHFGFDAPATGFAVNVGLAADTISKTEEPVKESIPDYLIYFDADDYVNAEHFRAEQLMAGNIAEYSCFDSIDETKKYASARGISKVAVFCGGRAEISEVDDI